MISILIELALIVFTCLATNFIAYKIIRRMDKKERIKLHEMETKYYNELKEKHDIIYGSEAEEEKEDKFYDNLGMLEELQEND